MICADGLSGIKEAVNAAFPQTDLQRCIVHQVRNTLKYVGAKNKKEFANDLKTIYHAPSEDAALNAIESLNSGYRRLNKQRSVFPSDTALLKALYLATHEITKKWTMPLRNWGRVLGELEIMYPDRLSC